MRAFLLSASLHAGLGSSTLWVFFAVPKLPRRFPADLFLLMISHDASTAVLVFLALLPSAFPRSHQVGVLEQLVFACSYSQFWFFFV